MMMQKIAVRALAAFLAERGIDPALLASASHRVLYPLRGGFKRQEDSNGAAEAEHL
ncbi:MAG: hypothetical protein IKJ21_00595 [Alistipes sp.]|nr:hypothetical protein [Alistipes sp.]